MSERTEVGLPASSEGKLSDRGTTMSGCGGPFFVFMESCERVFLFLAGLSTGLAVMAASERLVGQTAWLATGAATYLSSSLWFHSALRVWRQGGRSGLATLLSWVTLVGSLLMFVGSFVTLWR